VVAILTIAYFWFGPGAPDNSGGDTKATIPTGVATTAGKPAMGVAPGRAGGRGNLMPQPLKLAEMEQIPEEPHPTRNIFRFGVPPPPPLPKPTPTPTPVWTPPPVVTPPPIPPIPLKLNTILPHAAQPGVWVAYVQEEKPPNAPPGAIFEALQGEIVDGRYKVHVVTQNSIVMSYLDGTGRRTWQLPGK
jgi:hypothetical protein